MCNPVRYSSGELVNIVESQEVFDISEVGVYESESVVVDTVAERIHIAIERQEPAIIIESFHNCTRMASATKSNINIRSVGADIQQFQSLRQKSRYVIR